ncbi:MAG: ferredoxin [Candidatus Omnitrophica bacterium]|nr:ferredoxin [Candidatus Omnitrophota bacterium]
MKAVVNQEICIGCTLCVQACPGVFRMEGDKAVAYVEPVPEVSSDLCRSAASQCPVTAITIIE